MPATLFTSFGSKYVLEKIQKKYPNRSLILLSNVSEPTSLQLLDFSNQGNIFNTPNRYLILFKNVSRLDGKYFKFDFFDLTTDTFPTFKEKIISLNKFDYKSMNGLFLLKVNDNKPQNYVILTVWYSRSNAFSSNILHFNHLIERYKNRNYFQTSYSLINPVLKK